MRQLERLIGADAMRDGLRAYLKQFAFGNATWLDLVKVLDERTDRDLAAWSRGWVEEAGRPTIETAPDRWERRPDGRIDRLEFSSPIRSSDRQLRWTEKLDVLVSAAAGLQSLPVELGDERVRSRGCSRSLARRVRAADRRRPRLRQLRPRCRQPARTASHVVPELSDPVARGAAWVTLWEEMLDRRVAAPAFVDAVLQALPREDVQQNASLLVGYLRDAFWRFLPADARERLAPTVEKTLRDGIARAATSSAEGDLLHGFRSMVTTPDGVAFLERVWARQEKIPGLTLAEPDEAAMALDLAVRGGAERRRRFSRSSAARFTNPDRKARFEFVMPALAASPETRDAFFAESRRREEPPARAVGRRRLVAI